MNGRKYSRLFAIALAVLLVEQMLTAHDVITTKLTYTREISRIFARRCVSCHGNNSSIPLTSYRQARPWAVDIKQEVLSRAMPPWGAVKGFADLSPDESLTQEEISIIAAWVVGGAPEGDPAKLPKLEEAALPATQRLDDALLVSTRTLLHRPLAVAGVRPEAESVIESARITACLPDGRITPLLWLYRYDPRWKQVYRFRQIIELPSGTVVEASSPVRFWLEASTALSPERKRPSYSPHPAAGTASRRGTDRGAEISH